MQTESALAETQQGQAEHRGMPAGGIPVYCRKRTAAEVEGKRCNCVDGSCFAEKQYGLSTSNTDEAGAVIEALHKYRTSMDAKLRGAIDSSNRQQEQIFGIQEKLNQLEAEKGGNPGAFSPVLYAAWVAAISVFGTDDDRKVYLRKRGWVEAADTSWLDPQLNQSSASYHIAIQRQMRRDTEGFKQLLNR